MISLFCLVCRCNLKDGRLIKENEIFETDAVEAEILIRGGIAKLAPEPAPVPFEQIPAQVIGQPSVLEDPEPTPEETQKPAKKRR